MKQRTTRSLLAAVLATACVVSASAALAASGETPADGADSIAGFLSDLTPATRSADSFAAVRTADGTVCFGEVNDLTEDPGLARILSPDSEVASSDGEMQAALLRSTEEDAGIQPRTNGDLAAGNYFAYDRQYLRAGQQVTISISYTPTSAQMQIGLLNTSSSTIYTTVSGGSGSTTLELLQDGYYYIYVGNPSSSSVDFNVTYVVT